MSIDNFKIQIRKGLIEFCVLQIISRGEVYTSDIIDELQKSKIIVVEGTDLRQPTMQIILGKNQLRGLQGNIIY